MCWKIPMTEVFIFLLLCWPSQMCYVTVLYRLYSSHRALLFSLYLMYSIIKSLNKVFFCQVFNIFVFVTSYSPQNWILFLFFLVIFLYNLLCVPGDKSLIMQPDLRSRSKQCLLLYASQISDCTNNDTSAMLSSLVRFFVRYSSLTHLTFTHSITREGHTCSMVPLLHRQGAYRGTQKGGENTEKNQLLLLNPLQKSPLNAYDIHLNK